MMNIPFQSDVLLKFLDKMKKELLERNSFFLG